LSYLDKKNLLIKNLKLLGCNLLRDDSDIDFGLIDKEREEEVYNYLIKEEFICTSRDSKKINFKKFVEGKILDVDVEINTKFLKQYFYNIEIKKNFEEEYFKYPDKNQIAMKTVRYMMLLRGKEIKYRNFLLENRKEIEENNFFLDKLTVNPFKKEINFDIFISIVKVNKIAIVRYVKFQYILYFIYFKIKSFFIKRRGVIVAINGVDGAGKTTIINILTKELNKPSLYMGERGYKYEKFYTNKKHFLLKPFSLIGQYLEKIYRVFKARKLARKFGIVVSDRYHYYSKTITDKKCLDIFNKFFYFFYPKPDKYIVFWNEPEIILSRKQEVTKEYIDELNKNKEVIYKGATFIKNDNIDDTLNLVLKKIYA